MSDSNMEEVPESRLWIGNLDLRLREYQLLKLVEKFGPLMEFDFLYHRSGAQSGQPRGYAFVTYKSVESAKKAQKTLDGLELLGRRVAVKWAHAQDETKYFTKSKPAPAILSVTSKESSSKKPLSKDNKIAALEAKLKMLDNKNMSVSVMPDIGGPSRPTSVTYQYIEKKAKTSKSKHSSSKPYSNSQFKKKYS